jgi:hypothetical protein
MELIRIEITQEMKERAQEESRKRNPNIKHHFDVKHFTPEQRDELGFIGEFAACILFNIDWKGNIRQNYKTIDSKDLIINNKKVDVKTESVPSSFVEKIATRNIKDDEIYGRRLINSGQKDLLKKYDVVIFGLVDRDKLDFWYPVGWIESKKILADYSATNQRPDGGKYPFSALPIRTSELKDINKLS